MSIFARAAAFFAAALVLPAVAGAQSYQDFVRPRALPMPAAPDLANPFAKAGPTVYITDASSVLWTVTLGTYTVHKIGAEGVALTDIAFDPKDGNLYGISFSSFYRLSKTTGKATYVGPLGRPDANALVFDKNGVAYTAGVIYPTLSTINVKTGHTTTVGSTYPYASAGDLTFYNAELVLSAYAGGSPGNANILVELNAKTGKPSAAAALSVGDVYGLVSTGTNLLFGFAQTSLYQLYPGEKTVSKRAVLLKNLASKGVAQIYGAAYDGAFQN